MSLFALSQILVGIAICFDFLSFQFKERGRIVGCLLVSCTLISIHFMLLDHWTAACLGLFQFTEYSNSRELLCSIDYYRYRRNHPAKRLYRIKPS
ncbi:MAG: YgjV family protein [Desulforhopalus sp.]|nr:YgjV family protein [Desulforhopalus sp.]